MQKFIRPVTILIFLIPYFLLPCSAQVVINEVCSANSALIADEDGDYEDWVELYNPTNFVINLEKYSFVYAEPNKAIVTWTFWAGWRWIAWATRRRCWLTRSVLRRPD